MNRRLTLVTVVVVTLTIVVGLLNSIRLYAASSAEDTLTALVAAMAEAGFTRQPINQGQFTQASSTSVFRIEITNTGDAVSDTFELDVDSSWPVTLFGPDEATPITDTNGSGGLDTGVVLKGQSFTVVAEVGTPFNAKVGNANDAVLTIQSTISPTLAMTAMMQSAVPAPFAQSLFQQSNSDVSLLMSQPNGTWRATIAEDIWYGDTPDFAEMAVAETISGYVYIWNDFYGTNNNFFNNDLEYTLTDKPGQPVAAIAKLTDHSSSVNETWDTEPAVDVAPNGNIGVTWARRIKQSDGSELYNVYMSILDSVGNPVTDTINLTENLLWRDDGQTDFDAPKFRSPSIAATGDNHFFVAWESSILTYTEQVSTTYDLEDVYYAIYAADGVSVTQAINISNNVPGEGTRSLMPAMAGVKDDRVFLTWAQRVSGSDDIRFTVINSSNSIVKEGAPIADDDDPVDWYNSDVVELSNGQIIVSWLAFGCPGYESSIRIRYAVFQSNNYNQAGQPACLPPTVVAEGGDDRVSLVGDNQGRAIVTWASSKGKARKELFYALLKSNGQVITDPMIFFHSGQAGGLLGPGVKGYASASRIFLDAAIEIDPASGQGLSEELIPFAITYRNYGAVTGTDMVITMSLAPSLSYHSGNAPITPTIDGQNVVWTFPEALLPWEQESFDILVTIKPGAALMQSYPLTATIDVAGNESDLSNNHARATVLVSRPTFIPFVMR